MFSYSCVIGICSYLYFGLPAELDELQIAILCFLLMDRTNAPRDVALALIGFHCAVNAKVQDSFVKDASGLLVFLHLSEVHSYRSRMRLGQ